MKHLKISGLRSLGLSLGLGCSLNGFERLSKWPPSVIPPRCKLLQLQGATNAYYKLLQNDLGCLVGCSRLHANQTLAPWRQLGITNSKNLPVTALLYLACKARLVSIWYQSRTHPVSRYLIARNCGGEARCTAALSGL
ncbi:hypothetical protein BXZ70DRAFT_311731 [Cristinia sonorae]|uniref:Uncharacterized protein n=1 Tax=Cristinia sonorae TaxID=1940300 RepID=A0A8K0XNS8_9AGAR|nr:hypothetical protein BXZ70DRAFT_311731 [Cristinia sonorae]